MLYMLYLLRSGTYIVFCFWTKQFIAAEFWVDELEDKTAASQIKTLFSLNRLAMAQL